jgi:hypothetical protein
MTRSFVLPKWLKDSHWTTTLCPGLTCAWTMKFCPAGQLVDMSSQLGQEGPSVVLCGPTYNSMNSSPIILIVAPSSIGNTHSRALLVKKLWPIMDITEVTLCNSTSSTHIHAMSTWCSTKKTYLQAETASTATSQAMFKACANLSQHTIAVSLPTMPLCRCWQAACSWAAGSAMMGAFPVLCSAVPYTHHPHAQHTQNPNPNLNPNTHPNGSANTQHPTHKVQTLLA